jgi:D-tyrosyl-tRNA(Tyr) deacylase
VRALVQRVARASVSVVGDDLPAPITGDGQAGIKVGEIAGGLLVLLGITHSDDRDCAERLAAKVRALRIFPDAAGRMNEPLGDREILCVSQFTLYGEVRRGTRPSFVAAAAPEQAEPLYSYFCDQLGAQRGRFGAKMLVELVNDGPVTLMLETQASSAG